MIMMRKLILFLLAALPFFAGCSMMQSIMKSTFPYTADLVIPASSAVGESYSAISTANSFDQGFSKDGNNANRIKEVRIVSAKLQSNNPSTYNIGDVSALRIYMAKADGSDEVLVAIRKDIAPNAGNSIVLDIDNSHFLDELVRQQSIRVRMAYVLRKQASIDVSLKVTLSIASEPR